MAGVGFPTTLQEITADWLTQVLRDDGVHDYSFEAFYEDYRACVMLGWCWPVTAIGSLDMANERGVALFRAWTERAMAAILDLDAGAAIP